MASRDVIERAKAAVDDHCLTFCISLLNHTLTGDIYESVIVGFFAVASVDEDKRILREAHNYGLVLSGFVKMAQMLVIQRAVVGAERGEAAYPADLLDEMRDRFLLYGTRSPFSWACRLRSYAKKVRDTTTSLGYISWSDDGGTVSYKQVSGLTMLRLRDFVRIEVHKAQTQLEELLLLHPDESREDLGVDFRMHRVTDNASESRQQWNFLQLELNRSGPLPSRDTWLFERVLDNEWLKDEFLRTDKAGAQAWRPSVVEKYKTKVDKFLEILLLLVHITGGQPARGTEILSLRYVNTICGYHRNIFTDHGVVNTVTTYHKGYNVTGSIKIIYRFLPKEIGELVIYYLWLVLPFCQQLDLLVFRSQEQPSPFLWPKHGGRDCWASERLSQVLKREFRNELQVPMSITVWRHLAIAISRKHLACGGFKRDYELDDTTFDKQSAHSSRTTGSVYARGLEEAAGHVEARRSEYRKVSREWHAFLGFTQSELSSRKQPIAPTTRTSKASSILVSPKGVKRGCATLENAEAGQAKRVKSIVGAAQSALQQLGHEKENENLELMEHAWIF